ncbi:hypothetical protein R1sor_012391 [Riccia sorocarpa]|uniref:Uncharacterized protein n=1 Tax=Riccia sorocarpa TaxID=122646 RepID=A0ABD3I7F3_9MARC
MASLTVATAGAMQVGSICAFPTANGSSATLRTASVNMQLASSAHFSSRRLRIITAARPSLSVRPSVLVIRAEDQGPAGATKSDDKTTNSSPDVGNDPGSFFSAAGKDLKENVQKASQVVTDKAGDLADQAKDVGQDFGIKADQAKNKVTESAEETADRFAGEAVNLADEARNPGESINKNTDQESPSAKSELQGTGKNALGESSAQAGVDDAATSVTSGLDKVYRKAGEVGEDLKN